MSKEEIMVRGYKMMKVLSGMEPEAQAEALEIACEGLSVEDRVLYLAGVGLALCGEWTVEELVMAVLEG